jgi:hypothetical protein
MEFILSKKGNLTNGTITILNADLSFFIKKNDVYIPKWDLCEKLVFNSIDEQCAAMYGLPLYIELIEHRDYIIDDNTENGEREDVWNEAVYTCIGYTQEQYAEAERIKNKLDGINKVIKLIVSSMEIDSAFKIDMNDIKILF